MVTLFMGTGRCISFAFNEMFRKKRFHYLICCDWKMASDELDFGGVLV